MSGDNGALRCAECTAALLAFAVVRLRAHCAVHGAVSSVADDKWKKFVMSQAR